MNQNDERFRNTYIWTLEEEIKKKDSQIRILEKGMVDLSVDLNNTVKEIERLQKELADQSATTVDYIIEKRKLKSDNEKLREALQKISETEPESDGNGDWWHMIIARAALKGDE